MKEVLINQFDCKSLLDFLYRNRDYNRRQLAIFNFLDAFGIDTSDWKKRIECEEKLMEENKQVKCKEEWDWY